MGLTEGKSALMSKREMSVIMWWRITLVVIAVVGIIVVAMSAYGWSRWRAETRQLKAAMEAVKVPPRPELYDSTELANLPAPVQRYLSKALTEGQPMIAAAHVEQKGTFNRTLGSDTWIPFTATQDVVTQRPGFVWDARMTMAGIPVHIHDAYVAGEGILEGKVLGLMTVMEMRGTPEAAEGELYRYLAESAWYPTALLPSQGAQWEAVDDSSARVTLEDGGTRVTMLFRFSEDNLIESVYAEQRGREVNGQLIPTPWEGRWSHYESHNGMLVPMQGEVAWILPDGRKPYWRGTIARLTYSWAEGDRGSERR